MEVVIIDKHMSVDFNEQNYTQSQYGNFDENPKGMTGKLITWGIAKNQKTAQMILAGLVVVLVMTTIFVLVGNREQIDESRMYDASMDIGDDV